MAPESGAAPLPADAVQVASGDGGPAARDERGHRGHRGHRGRRRGGGEVLRELVVLVALAIAVAFVVKTFVAQVFFIPSASMVPQMEVGDRVVVSKTAFRLHDPRRGDIVVFDAPVPGPPDRSTVPVRAVRAVLQSIGLAAPSTEEYIKRVVALPGERVEARAGHVYVDGRLLVEPYLPPGDATRDFAPVEVERGQLFVLGDNRGNSSDSRSFGPIRRSTLVGRAFARIWPSGRAAFL